MKSEVVIIGAGHAGGMAAINLRQKKFKGSILIIGEENYIPYQRPALSKGFLTDDIQEKSLFLKSKEFYKKNNISLITNKSVIKINKKQKILELKNKEEISYKKLVIATGSKMRRINGEAEKDNICYVRTINDSLKIKSLLNRSKNLCIIGSGYIGLELAAIGIKKNLSVTVIELDNRVMSRVACSDLSNFFQAKHEAEGVYFKLNTSVKSLRNKADNIKVLCDNQENINADLIIVGIGIIPNTLIAEESGILCDDGILVDQNCVTSDPDILAIGDCTNHFNNIYNNRLRLESVQNAVGQAKTAASYIVGKPQSYNEVPWFWSEQYNLKLQIAGISDNFDTKIINGSIKDEKFSIYYLRKEKLISVHCINQQKAFLKGKKLIEQGEVISIDSIKKDLIEIK
ncbi:MAG: FAD-dependent oxidoreductase [Pelagibacterales bacterium]|nr:FAD-dependent oxidoreductase [Pelagibacterales bacterium]